MVSSRNQQRVAALRIYRNRILNWNRSNAPFLSGDGIASLCDVSVFPPRYRGVIPTIRKISSAHSIFCPSDKLELLISTYSEAINASVLVLGNSDRDFYERVTLPTSVKKVFLQNSHISDAVYQTLPIGIENLRWGRNGFKSLVHPSFSQVKKMDSILVGPFSPTHEERNDLEQWKSYRDPRLKYCLTNQEPSQLARLSSEFKFIACPRGNGTDTHRFWETLYRGSVPVVKESRWSNSIKSLGIPVLELQGWDYDEFLEKRVVFNGQDPKLIEALWLDFWQNRFRI